MLIYSHKTDKARSNSMEIHKQCKLRRCYCFKKSHRDNLWQIYEKWQKKNIFNTEQIRKPILVRVPGQIPNVV